MTPDQWWREAREKMKKQEAEIKRLKVRNAELVAALKKIIKKDRIDYGLGSWEDGGCAKMARCALEGK